MNLGIWINQFEICKLLKGLTTRLKGPLGSDREPAAMMERFGEKTSQRVDYRYIVGDTQPSLTSAVAPEGERYFRQSSHGHGHETAAQRYSATRVQAGLVPER